MSIQLVSTLYLPLPSSDGCPKKPVYHIYLSFQVCRRTRRAGAVLSEVFTIILSLLRNYWTYLQPNHIRSTAGAGINHTFLSSSAGKCSVGCSTVLATAALVPVHQL